jgi:HEAT repeat protein
VLVVIALLADSRTHAVLVDGLTDRNPDVRKASAFALKRIGTHKSREALEQAVDELSWRRARFARRALRDVLQAR